MHHVPPQASVMDSKGAFVLSLFIGTVREVPAAGSEAWWDKEWRTGFFKEPVTTPQWLGYEGFRGDEQADRRHHGGVDKAVCVYPAEHYGVWRALSDGPDLPQGAFGENLCVQGLIESQVCIGDVYQLGTSRVQVSQPRQPCWKLARRWRIKDLTAQVERSGRSGFYFRVLEHGLVQAGDELHLEERPCPQWTVLRCHEIMHHHRNDAILAKALAECSQLSASWKDGLWARAQKVFLDEAQERRRTQPPCD